jgi:hypothetical protein
MFLATDPLLSSESIRLRPFSPYCQAERKEYYFAFLHHFRIQATMWRPRHPAHPRTLLTTGCIRNWGSRRYDDVNATTRRFRLE